MYGQTEIKVGEESENNSLYWELVNWGSALEEEIEQREQSEFKQNFGIY